MRATFPTQSVTFMAVEDGALLPRVSPVEQGEHELVVIAQDGARPSTFLYRISRALLALERRCRRVERAVFVTGTTPAADRAGVARILATHLAPGPQAVLDVVAAPDLDAHQRHELFGLADVLTRELPRRATLRVRFDGTCAPLDSGLFARTEADRASSLPPPGQASA